MRSTLAVALAALAATVAAQCPGFVVTENPDLSRCEFRFCDRPDRPEMIAFCKYPNSCIGGTSTTRCLTPEGTTIPANSV